MPGIPLYFCADCLRSSHPVSWRCSCKGNAQQQAPLGPPLEPPPATPQPQPPGSPSVTAFVKSSWMPQSQTVVFPRATPQRRSRRAMEPPVPLDGKVQRRTALPWGHRFRSTHSTYWNPIWCSQLVFNSTVCGYWRTGQDLLGLGQSVVVLANTCWFLWMAVRLGRGTRIVTKL
jgi:hypothetical protein